MGNLTDEQVQHAAVLYELNGESISSIASTLGVPHKEVFYHIQRLGLFHSKREPIRFYRFTRQLLSHRYIDCTHSDSLGQPRYVKFCFQCGQIIGSEKHDGL